MGLTSAGLTIPTLLEIQQEIIDEIHVNVDATLDLSSDSPDGEIVAIYASHTRELYETIQALYESFDPAAAEGATLENVSSLTGTLREGVTFSTVEVELVLGASFSAAAGTMKAAVVGFPDRIFANDEEVTSTTAGTYTAQFTATVSGPIVANAGTLTVISVPLSGWTSVTNPEDAATGADVETDPDLRLRREAELAAQGSTSVDALRARILQFNTGTTGPRVLACKVYENTSALTDLSGRPAHSIEVVVHAPDVEDDDIAQLIWDHHAGGIVPYGLTSGAAVDSLGVSHLVFFSRATEKEIWITYTFHYNVALGAVQASETEERVIEAGSGLLVGDDVSFAKLLGAAVGTLGVTNVTLFKLGFAPGPSSSVDLVIGEREIATLDTTRITATDPNL